MQRHSFNSTKRHKKPTMKSVAFCIVLAAYLANTEALRCMTCYGSGSVDECDARGNIKQCMPNEKSCETTMRRSGDHITVMKGCKNSRACKDNQKQNSKYSGRSTQCNLDQDNSFCTCCCTKDMCNVGVSTCKLNYPQVSYDGKDCPVVPPSFPHGNVGCYKDNKFCEYECTEKDYFVWPAGSEINVCLRNGSWAREAPCCARPCPPYRIADSTMLFHHTGESGKRLMEQLHKVVYAPIAEDGVKLSVLSYGDDVIESSVVKFNDYDANATLLTQLITERQVLSEGPGDTGLAMQYALDNLLTPEAGMRTNSKVMKTLELHTNTQPNDNAIEVGKKARERGFLVYVFGFELDGFEFDRERLLQITGDEKHLFIFQSYYTNLTPKNRKDLNDHFCPHPCDHSLHFE